MNVRSDHFSSERLGESIVGLEFRPVRSACRLPALKMLLRCISANSLALRIDVPGAACLKACFFLIGAPACAANNHQEQQPPGLPNPNSSQDGGGRLAEPGLRLLLPVTASLLRRTGLPRRRRQVAVDVPHESMLLL